MSDQSNFASDGFENRIYLKYPVLDFLIRLIDTRSSHLNPRREQFKILKSATSLLLLLVLSGCAGINIKRIEIVENNQESITIQVETKSNFTKYDDSFFSYKVFLKYAVWSQTATPKYEGSSVTAHEFPFSAERIQSGKCIKNANFCSTWEIPLSNKFRATTEYEYELQETDAFKFQFSGGTMHGTRITSNKVLLNYP